MLYNKYLSGDFVLMHHVISGHDCHSTSNSYMHTQSAIPLATVTCTLVDDSSLPALKACHDRTPHTVHGVELDDELVKESLAASVQWSSDL
jgi:hypothetical protein